jgi:hypothetical protein
MKYVRIKKAAELFDYSVRAIQSKIYRNDWLEGTHYVKAPDGRVFIDVEEVEKWIAGSNPTTDSEEEHESQVTL